MKKSGPERIIKNLNFLIYTIAVVSIVILLNLASINVNLGKVISSMDDMNGESDEGPLSGDEAGGGGTIGGTLPDFITKPGGWWIVPGGGMHVGAWTTNNGTGTAWNYIFSKIEAKAFTANGELCPNAYQERSWFHEHIFRPFQSSAISIALRCGPCNPYNPANSTEVAYYDIKLDADVTNTVVESDETNNANFYSVLCTSNLLPDYKSIITGSPGTKDFPSVLLEIKTENVGPVHATAYSRTQLIAEAWADGKRCPLADRRPKDRFDIPPLNSKEFTLDNFAISCGRCDPDDPTSDEVLFYDVRTVADVFNNITESNENNNGDSKRVLCWVAVPDYISYINGSNMKTDGIVYFNVVTENILKPDAKEWSTTIMSAQAYNANGTQCPVADDRKSFSILPLPGESSTSNLTSLTCGRCDPSDPNFGPINHYDVRTVADVNGYVEEEDEGNNEGFGQVKCNLLPELPDYTSDISSQNVVLDSGKSGIKLSIHTNNEGTDAPPKRPDSKTKLVAKAYSLWGRSFCSNANLRKFLPVSPLEANEDKVDEENLRCGLCIPPFPFFTIDYYDVRTEADAVGDPPHNKVVESDEFNNDNYKRIKCIYS